MQAIKKFGSNWWSISLLGLCLLVSSSHSIGYNFGLPYVAEFDEARMFWNAYSIRTNQPEMIDLTAYPPAIFGLNMLVQPFTELYTNDPAELHMGMSVGILRLMAVAVNALSAVLIALITRELSHPLVGLLAGVWWAFNPILIYQTVLALTEGWQNLFVLLAVYAFCLSLKQGSAKLAIASTLAALVAFLFKYSVFPVLGLGLFASIWNFYPNKRQLFKLLAGQLALIGVLMAYLLFGYGLSNLSGPEPAALVSRNYLEIFSWHDLQLILEAACTQLSLPLYFLIAPLLAIPLKFRKTERYQQLSFILILLGLALHYLLILQYINYWEAVTRYVTPASGLLIISFAVGLYSILNFLADMIPARRWIYGLSLMSICTYFVLGPLTKTIPFLYRRTLPHTSGQLASWSLGLIVEGDTILQDMSIRHSNNGARVFSRSTGGWQGIWLDALGVHFEEKSVEEWQAEGFDYYLSDDLLQSPDMLLMNQFPPSGQAENWQGAPHYFYRLGGIQHETDFLFGAGIRLRGYDLSLDITNEAIQAGETLEFRSYWQAQASPEANYNLFLHIYPSDEVRLIAQADAAPVSANRLSKTWIYPDETLIGQWLSLTIPPDTPAGTYQLVLGLYDTETNQRLTTSTGDFILISEFEIEN